jgi:hypothetical protein
MEYAIGFAAFILTVAFLLRFFDWNKQNDLEIARMIAEQAAKYINSEAKLVEAGYKHLGTANGWEGRGGSPKVVQDCCAAGHATTSINVSMNYSIEFCPQCKYYYFVDGSD